MKRNETRYVEKRKLLKMRRMSLRHIPRVKFLPRMHVRSISSLRAPRMGPSFQLFLENLAAVAAGRHTGVFFHS